MKTTLTKIADNLSDKEQILIADKLLKSNCDGLELSIFGENWGKTWDVDKNHNLNFLHLYKGIKALSLDIPNCTNLSPILELKNSLEYLHLGEFNSKKTSYEFLSEFKELKLLSVVRQPRGLESIVQLKNLHKLCLTGYSVDKLDFLNKLNTLKQLYIGFGTSESLNTINQLSDLEELYILWVKKLSDITAISNLTNLQKLRIEDEKQIKAFPDISNLKHLKNIRLMNLSSLENISSLKNSFLEEFILTGPNKDAEILRQIENAESIKRIYTYFYSNKEQAKAEKIVGNKFSNKLENELETSRVIAYIDYKTL